MPPSPQLLWRGTGVKYRVGGWRKGEVVLEGWIVLVGMDGGVRIRKWIRERKEMGKWRGERRESDRMGRSGGG